MGKNPDHHKAFRRESAVGIAFAWRGRMRGEPRPCENAVQIATLTPHPSRPSREIGAIHLPLEGEGLGLSP